MLWHLSCDRGCKGICLLQDNYLLEDSVHISPHHVLALLYAEVRRTSSVLPQCADTSEYLTKNYSAIYGQYWLRCPLLPPFCPFSACCMLG